jgi:hypothetical protein
MGKETLKKFFQDPVQREQRHTDKREKNQGAKA